ncbi:hypothetical protein ACS0TY_022458 [Phlomoides rotata]
MSECCEGLFVEVTKFAELLSSVYYVSVHRSLGALEAEMENSVAKDAYDEMSEELEQLKRSPYAINDMKTMNVSPNQLHPGCQTLACDAIRDFNLGKTVQGSFSKLKLCDDLHVLNSMIRMYCSCENGIMFFIDRKNGIMSFFKACAGIRDLSLGKTVPGSFSKLRLCDGQNVDWEKKSTVREAMGEEESFQMRMRRIVMITCTSQPVPDGSNDPRWGKFKGYLGALDGTYIDVHVPITEKGRYRNRKGLVTVNVLGSAADSRVLRDAINRTHRLKVPKGNYYLCDNGYPNCEGFLTPYKGVRYHLSEWSSRRPQNYQEYFNMKHTRARNVIECTFGLLKMRWGILHSPSWYPVRVHNQVIMACCLLHNYIRKEMEVDPFEHGLDEFMNHQEPSDVVDNVDIIESLDTSPEWTAWRDTTTHNMFNEWAARQ